MDLSLLTGAFAVGIGVIAGGITSWLTNTHRQKIRGCDDCGTQLTTTDGTHCPHCVALKRSILQTQGDHVKGLRP